MKNSNNKNKQQNAYWKTIANHIMDCMFGDKVIHILMSDFIIERVGSNVMEKQSKLWNDVLDLISDSKSYGTTLNKLKETFVITDKKTMTKREQLSFKAKINNQKIEALHKKNIELLQKSYLLSDDKQQFIEKEETSGKGKKKVVQLVGRIHWIQKFKDNSTGKYISIERSRPVRINGEWI